jgi:hypothetical protein
MIGWLNVIQCILLKGVLYLLRKLGLMNLFRHQDHIPDGVAV